MKKLELNNLRNMIREVLSNKLVTEVALDPPATEEEKAAAQAELEKEQEEYEARVSRMPGEGDKLSPKEISALSRDFMDRRIAKMRKKQGQAAPPTPTLGDTEALRQRTAQRQAAASGGDTTEKAKAALSSVLLPAVQQISDNNPAAMASIQSMPDAALGSLVKQLMGNTSGV